MNIGIDIDPDTQSAVLGYMANQSLNSTSKANTHRSGNTHRAAQLRTTRSDTTSESFTIKELTAQVGIDPPAGLLEPGERRQLTVSIAGGMLPQRIRGWLRCNRFDVSGTWELPPMTIAVRGEIQAPHVIVHPSIKDLGLIYVGDAVSFQLEIINLTNLPSKYKIEKLTQDDSKYILRIKNPHGKIDAKERIILLMELQALQDDLTIESFLSCRYFGSPDPLGLLVTAVSRGISVDFMYLNDSNVPDSLSTINVGTTPRDVSTLTIGDPFVQLYETSLVYVLIRNLSGTKLTYALHISKYLSSDDISSEEVKNEASAGKKQVVEAKVGNRKYLAYGNGAAFKVIPSSGSIDPWSTAVICIEAYNDSPGSFRDELKCIFTASSQVERTYTLPIEMIVRGCPLVVEKSTFGMSLTGRGYLLKMGSAGVKSQILRRELRVRNHGAKVALLSWNIKSVVSKFNGIIKFTISPTSDGKRLKSSIRLWDDIAENCSFSILPTTAEISPGKQGIFQVLPGISKFIHYLFAGAVTSVNGNWVNKSYSHWDNSIFQCEFKTY